MFLKQYYLGCLAHASYMIADERTKVAAIVDPQRDIDIYLEDAKANGFEIKYVFLTHFHADFLAGHIELRDLTGAHIYLQHACGAEFDFMPVKDNDVIEFGDVRIKLWETPGHTPEGITLLVHDLTKSDEIPYAALTGDTLFIGDVGRPDLLASIGVTADELAAMLYESIERIKTLPDETLVYPAHGAGSLCGKNLSDETVSTIGEQKKFNYALQPMSRDEFIKIVEADQEDAPDYFVYDAIKNRQERPNLAESMQDSLKPLSLDEVLNLQREDAQILDVRDGIDFEGGHLKGSLNIGLQGKYATWCGSLLSHDEPIVIVAETDGHEEAIMRLGRIGFDNVTGYLDGGMLALSKRGELVESSSRITAQALADQLAGSEAPTVLDIRSPGERKNNGVIEGAINISLNHLKEKIADVPTSKPLVVHCAGGYRSAIGVSVLAQNGIVASDLVGGFAAWKASDLPIVNEVATA